MWQDKLAQEFWNSGRRQVAALPRYQRLGTLSFIGVVMIVAISSVSKAPAVAALLTDTLPPANLPANQTSVVNVPLVNRPEASTAIAQTWTMPPATLPPAVFPTNQTPTVSVPPLQPIPTQTPTPVTTSQPLERASESVSPALSSSPVIEFGQPLPKTTPAHPLPTPERTLPRL
jgi:hypothetical protein